MSVEKCFTVYFPFKSKTVCTVRTAKWATGVVGIILRINDSLQSYFRKSIMKSSGQHSCIYTSDIRTFRSVVSSVLYSLGPFTLMFLSNIAIILKLMRAKCERNSTESTSQVLAKSATRGTAMVVTVSVMFLLLTAPTTVEYTHTLSSTVRLSSNPVYNVLRFFTQFLNHSINGVLYIIVRTRAVFHECLLFQKLKYRYFSAISKYWFSCLWWYFHFFIWWNSYFCSICFRVKSLPPFAICSVVEGKEIESYFKLLSLKMKTIWVKLDAI